MQLMLSWPCATLAFVACNIENLVKLTHVVNFLVPHGHLKVSQTLNAVVDVDKYCVVS